MTTTTTTTPMILDQEFTGLEGDTLSLATEPLNDPPVPGTNLVFTVNEGSSVGDGGFIRLSDYVTDPDDFALGFRLLGISSLPNQGMSEGYSSNVFSLSGSGLFSYDSSYLNLQPGQQLTETFHYVVTDGVNSSLGSFSVVVIGGTFGGLPPAAPHDHAITPQGITVSLEIFANDTLNEFFDLGSISLAITGLSNTEGSVGIVRTSPAHFPSLVFTPNASFTGVATFSYEVTYEWFPSGATEFATGTYTADVSVVVVPGSALPAPEGVADTYKFALLPSFHIDALLGVLVNDLAPSGGGIAAQLVSGPSQGRLDFNADGSFTYWASAEMLASAHGTEHQVTFTYRAFNGSAQDAEATEVTLQLRQRASDPVAFNDFLNGVEDQSLLITPESLFGPDDAGPLNDTQADGQAFTEIRITRLPENGTLKLDGIAVNVNQSVSVAQLSAGKLVFVPSPNYSGSTSFDYVVRSNDDVSNPATVTLTIADVPDPPTRVSPRLDVLEFTEAADASAQTLAAPLPPLQFLDPDSVPASVNIDVLFWPPSVAIHLPPLTEAALENAFTFTQDIAISEAGALLTLSPTFSTGPINLDFLRADEVLQVNYRIVITDDDGTQHMVDGFPVHIVGTNDAPLANDFSTAVDMGTAVAPEAGVLAHVLDADAGDTLRLVSIGGQYFAFNASVFIFTDEGELIFDPNGGYVFNPFPQGRAMTAADFFRIDLPYVVADAAGAVSMATMSLTVRGVNEAPDAGSDAITGVLTGGSIEFSVADLLANDIDTDQGETALLRVASFSYGPAVLVVPETGSATITGTYGILTIDANGQLSYAATTAASAAVPKGVATFDVFAYTVVDPYGASSTADLIFGITGANRVPVSVSDSYTTTAGKTLTVAAAIGVLENDSDGDGDPLSAILQTGPANGTLVLNPDGSFTYTPVAGYVGTDSFIYRAFDGTVQGAGTQVTISVQAPPPPPPPVLALDKALFINEIAVNAGAATITINTNNGALPDRVTTGTGRIELFNFSSSSISAADLAKLRLEVVGLNAKLSVIALGSLTGLTESAGGTPLTGLALQANGALVLYEPNASGIGIWQTYSATGTLLLSGTYQDTTWGMGTSVASPIAVNLVESGQSIDFFAANGAPLSGLTDTASSQNALSGLGALSSGAHAPGSISPFQLPDRSSPWFGQAQVSPSGAVIPGDVLNLLNQNAQFSGLLASSSDTVFARTYDRYLSPTGGSDPAFVDHNDAGDWTYGGSGIFTPGRENVLLSKGVPLFVANTRDGADDANPLQGYQPFSDLIAGITNESGQTIAIFSGYGEGGRGHDFLYGVATDDFLMGGIGNDYLYGSAGNDLLDGGSGADRLIGAAGNDRLFGGSGPDRLNGGSGADVFLFRSLSDSTLAAPDIIEDFVKGIDKIDLSAIDANTKRAGDQAFAFAGRSTGVVANAVSWFESGGNTVVQVDVDANKTADMQIVLLGTNLGLTAADFVL